LYEVNDRLGSLHTSENAERPFIVYDVPPGNQERTVVRSKFKLPTLPSLPNDESVAKLSAVPDS